MWKQILAVTAALSAVTAAIEAVTTDQYNCITAQNTADLPLLYGKGKPNLHPETVKYVRIIAYLKIFLAGIFYWELTFLEPSIFCCSPLWVDGLDVEAHSPAGWVSTPYYTEAQPLTPDTFHQGDDIRGR